jgi:hypothetical protein
MRKRIAVAICSAALLALPASAGAAPGQDIKAACGLSFGQLISGAKSTGTAAIPTTPGVHTPSAIRPSSQPTVAPDSREQSQGPVPGEPGPLRR